MSPLACARGGADFLSLLVHVLGCGASQVTASDSIAGGLAVWDSVCRHKL
jgi:hypothetical protein